MDISSVAVPKAMGNERGKRRCGQSGSQDVKVVIIKL